MSENVEATTLRQLTLSAEDSPVRTSATQGRGRASKKERGRASGMSSPESFASLGPDGCWLKTCQGFSQLTLGGEWEPYLETWPRAGTMQNGIAYQRRPSAPRTSVTGSSLWPTTVAQDDGKTPEAHLAMKARMKGGPRKTITSLQVMVKAVERRMWPTPDASQRGPRAADLMVKGKRQVRRRTSGQQRGMDLQTAVKLWPTPRANLVTRVSFREAQKRLHKRNSEDAVATPQCGQLNPTWVEGLMGFPFGWSDISERE